MPGIILDLWRNALLTLLFVGGPFIVVLLVVGLLVSLIQAATQLQENVLSFAPKLLAVGMILALCGHWLLDRLNAQLLMTAEALVQIGRSTL